MKKLVIILAVLLMVAGGVVSVMKTMGLGPFAPKHVAAEDGTTAPPRFIDVEPLNIPVFNENRVPATVQIQLKLEAIGKENEEQIIRLLPRISDAFLRDMHAFIPRLLKMKEGINVVIIKKRLQIISERLVGPNLINNILVQSISDSSASTSKKK
jgi:flagellar basal body-associated protein FliL